MTSTLSVAVMTFSTSIPTMSAIAAVARTRKVNGDKQNEDKNPEPVVYKPFHIRSPSKLALTERQGHVLVTTRGTVLMTTTLSVTAVSSSLSTIFAVAAMVISSSMSTVSTMPVTENVHSDKQNEDKNPKPVVYKPFHCRSPFTPDLTHGRILILVRFVIKPHATASPLIEQPGPVKRSAMRDRSIDLGFPTWICAVRTLQCQFHRQHTCVSVFLKGLLSFS